MPHTLARERPGHKGRMRQAGLIAAPAAAQRSVGPDAPPQRSPDPDIVSVAPQRFRAHLGNTASRSLRTVMMETGGAHFRRGRERPP